MEAKPDTTCKHQRTLQRRRKREHLAVVAGCCFVRNKCSAQNDAHSRAADILSRRSVYIHTVARGGGTRARAQCVHSSRIDPHHDGVNVCLSLSTLGVDSSACASRNLHYTALAAMGQTTTPDTGTACHTRSTQPLRDGITIQNASMLPVPSRLRPPPRKAESAWTTSLLQYQDSPAEATSDAELCGSKS